MAATIMIACPKCSREFSLRFDPGPEDWAPNAATGQLTEECPNHEGGWRIW